MAQRLLHGLEIGAVGNMMLAIVCRKVCTEALAILASFRYFVIMYSIARALISILNFEIKRPASSTFGRTFRYEAIAWQAL